MLTFKFQFPKTFQATAAILREHGGQMDCVRLLKLLYIADRELLADTGETLTGDEAVALKRGPVLHNVYSLIKERGKNEEQAKWNEAIRRVKHDDKDDEVALFNSVPIGCMTKAEVEKIHEVCLRFMEKNTTDLCQMTHDFPEWTEAFEKDEASPINWEVALTAMGRGNSIEEAHLLQKDQEQANAAFRG
jgi:uncharacterized phage-associated protein